MKKLKSFLLERNSFEYHKELAQEYVERIMRQYYDTNPKLDDFINDMEAEGWEYDDSYSDNKELYFAGSFLDNDDEIFVKIAIKKRGSKIELMGYEFES